MHVETEERVHAPRAMPPQRGEREAGRGREEVRAADEQVRGAKASVQRPNGCRQSVALAAMSEIKVQARCIREFGGDESTFSEEPRTSTRCRGPLVPLTLRSLGPLLLLERASSDPLKAAS